MNGRAHSGSAGAVRSDSARAIRAVLFDLDGTLIDSVELILASYRFALAAHGLPEPPRAHWIQGLGTPLAVQFAHFTRDERTIASLIASLIASYREHNLAHHDACVSAYPGALDAVRRLCASGVALGIVTSKRRDTARRGLSVCGYDGLFTHMVALEDCTRHKPDPEPVLRGLELVGVAAEDTLFVGDSPHDIRAGRAAHVRTGAALWGPFERADLAREEPDVWLETTSAIATLAR